MEPLVPELLDVPAEPLPDEEGLAVELPDDPMPEDEPDVLEPLALGELDEPLEDGEVEPLAAPDAEPMPEADPEAEPEAEGPVVPHAVRAKAQARGIIHLVMFAPCF